MEDEMSLKDASDGPVFAAKKTRINKAAIDIFGVIVKIQTLLTEASDKPYFPGSELLDLLCTLDGRITQLQALKGSRLTRLWLKKLERKKRALIRKKNETKLVEDWGVFERLLISESVEERHNRFVAREKVCSRKLNRASRQGGSNKDTVAALRTKLKKLKDRAGIFEDLAKSRGCDYKGERPKLQSTREKSRKRRRRKSIGHNRGLKSLLKVRQSWDKYLVGPGSGIAHQPRLD